MHKEGELELLREALGSEIQFLKSVSSCVMSKANNNYFRRSYSYPTQDYLPVRPGQKNNIFSAFCHGKMKFKALLCSSSFFSGFFVGLFFFLCLQKLDSSQESERH